MTRLNKLCLLAIAIVYHSFAAHGVAQDWGFSNTDPTAAAYLRKAQELENQLNELRKLHQPEESSFLQSAWNGMTGKKKEGVAGNAQVVGAPVKNTYLTQGESPWASFSNPEQGNWAINPVDGISQNIFANNRPRFELGVDGVFLARSAPSGGSFVFDDNGPALSYSDLDLGLNNGTRVNLAFMNAANTGFEFVYYGLEGNEEQIVAGPNVLPVFFNAIPADPQPSYTVGYNLDLDSYEFNVWTFARPRWRMGIGYRQIELAEEFDIIRTFDPTIGFRSDTINELRGVQLLVEHKRDLSRRLQVFGLAKFGWFDNDVEIEALALNEDLNVAENTSSFLADINAGLRVSVTDYFRLEVGYQALLFTEIATAPEQSANYDIFTDTGTTFFGNAPFHGFTVGAKLAY